MITYLGKNGEHVPGIPMRNLHNDEWAELPADLKKEALALGLYREPEKERDASRSDKKKED